jgi:5-methylcytosine-specific restriction endonuclease McrA
MARVAGGKRSRVRSARRRAARMDRADNDLTADQWQLILAAWGGCAYCGNAEPGLQKDCVLPLSRGGRYTLTNVVAACRSCNASKWHSEVTSWMRSRRLDEPRFLTRWYQITAELTARVAPEPLE